MIASLLAGVLADARGRWRRYCLRVAAGALAGLVAAMGLALLVGSAVLGLASAMTPGSAAAVTGGSLLVAAGLIVLAARLLRRRRRRSIGAPAGDRAIAELLSAMEDALGDGVRSEAPSLAAAALLVGCAIGASPELRRALADLVSR